MVGITTGERCIKIKCFISILFVESVEFFPDGFVYWTENDKKDGHIRTENTEDVGRRLGLLSNLPY